MTDTRSHSVTRDACAMAEAFAQGLSDPLQVLEDALQQATQVDHVFISMSVERARREAEASAARWKYGQPLSPFDGVPVAWKDLFDVAGCVTTAGATVRNNLSPALLDAPSVRLLARAGMVSLGKTNLSEFAYSGLGLNPHFGTPINPMSDGSPRIPGGSSSGSAVAVAAGIVPIAMGTDTAGSIRIPAAFNGLVGFRSTSRRYSRDGVFPLALTLDSVGPLTRSVRDALVIDDLLCARSKPTSLLPRSLAGQRFLVDRAVLEDERVAPAVRDNLLRAVEALRAGGALIEMGHCQAFQATLQVIQQHGWLGAAEAFALHQSLLDSDAASQLDPRVRKRLEAARHMPASLLVNLYAARERLQEQLTLELDGALLITPSVAHVAPPLAPLLNDEELFIQTNLATLRLTMPGSLLNMPGVSLPSGCDASGLPTGLLLSAPAGEDARLLRAALTVESLLNQP
ncbi:MULTISPECIES: amidase [Pseudomonas syringae group]|uniref:Amidase domain-containing protein n=2 Tax=Pseudomonas syringae group TaxID=136849 RepID=A0ABY1UB34_PSESX|nr:MULTISPECIES: amidase [Pseudomonas syringae group]KWT12918.1 amidase [Pseudomonas syringae pv. avii]PHN71222.1 amidase [Pseudomonas syringae]POQ08216.1 amidase [Pseudomonas syringae pv. avii]SOQ12921.1 amidase [Pseudomonas syringae pv. persicae]SOQ12937.1 amidase [Pseudomonas syringae pv. persicae]